MWEKYNKYAVLKVFFDDPVPEGAGFQLREIGRLAGLAPKSVKTYLEELGQEGLVLKKSHRIHGYPVYYANMESRDFLLYKKLDTARRIRKCGLLSYIEEKALPDCVVLFGSASRGQDIRGSDIDLYVRAGERKMDVSKFEAALCRKVNVLFASDFKSLSKELRSNIINGIILQGYLEAF